MILEIKEDELQDVAKVVEAGLAHVILNGIFIDPKQWTCLPSYALQRSMSEWRRDDMKHKKGDRVGAILGQTEEGIEFLGYGVYEGEEVPNDDAVGLFSEIARELGNTNPKIRLDSGKIVWGGECWWGSENKIKETLARCDNVIDVDIDEARASLE